MTTHRAAIAEQLGISQVVLSALTDQQLQHAADHTAHLPGETSGYSVYRISFTDGAVYVGISRVVVLERLEETFRRRAVESGAAARRRNPLRHRHHEHRAAGRVEIAALAQPLNS